MKKIIGRLIAMLTLTTAVMVGCKHKDTSPIAPGAQTATFTRTATGTATLIPTATRTMSLTPTATVTLSRTSTTTMTLTSTETATQTSSLTSTETSTATLTSSPTVTWTATATSTVTGTIQPTQATVNLRSATSYVVLAYSQITNSGPSTICGDLGLSPGTAVGGGYFMDCGGIISPNDTAAATAQLDVTTAYNDAAGRSNPTLVAGNLGGQTLYPGLYKSNGSLEISSGDLTLDGQGDPNAVFIFQIATTLSATAGRQVFVTNGAKSANVFWQVGSMVTFDTTVSFMGTIMAYAQINFNTGATLDGRAFSRTEQVTMLSNTITKPTP